MTTYVVAYSFPRLPRAWNTFRCEAENSLEAVRQCCTAFPTAIIQNVNAFDELLQYPEDDNYNE